MPEDIYQPKQPRVPLDELIRQHKAIVAGMPEWMKGRPPARDADVAAGAEAVVAKGGSEPRG